MVDINTNVAQRNIHQSCPLLQHLAQLLLVQLILRTLFMIPDIIPYFSYLLASLFLGGSRCLWYGQLQQSSVHQQNDCSTPATYPMQSYPTQQQQHTYTHT